MIEEVRQAVIDKGTPITLGLLAVILPLVIAAVAMQVGSSKDIEHLEQAQSDYREATNERLDALKLLLEKAASDRFTGRDVRILLKLMEAENPGWKAPDF